MLCCRLTSAKNLAFKLVIFALFVLLHLNFFPSIKISLSFDLCDWKSECLYGYFVIYTTFINTYSSLVYYLLACVQ